MVGNRFRYSQTITTHISYDSHIHTDQFNVFTHSYTMYSDINRGTSRADLKFISYSYLFGHRHGSAGGVKSSVAEASRHSDIISRRVWSWSRERETRSYPEFSDTFAQISAIYGINERRGVKCRTYGVDVDSKQCLVHVFQILQRFW